MSVVLCSDALLSVSTMSLSAKASTLEVTSSHKIKVGFFNNALCVCVVGESGSERVSEREWMCE